MGTPKGEAAASVRATFSRARPRAPREWRPRAAPAAPVSTRKGTAGAIDAGRDLPRVLPRLTGGAPTGAPAHQEWPPAHSRWHSCHSRAAKRPVAPGCPCGTSPALLDSMRAGRFVYPVALSALAVSCVAAPRPTAPPAAEAVLPPRVLSVPDVAPAVSASAPRAPGCEGVEDVDRATCVSGRRQARLPRAGHRVRSRRAARAVDARGVGPNDAAAALGRRRAPLRPHRRRTGPPAARRLRRSRASLVRHVRARAP